MFNIMERREIRKMVDAGMSQADVAKAWNVQQSTISRVCGEGLQYDSQKADRMEAFGLVTRDDGCYRTGVLNDEKSMEHEYVHPSHEVDWNTPDALLEAEQEIERRLQDVGASDNLE